MRQSELIGALRGAYTGNESRMNLLHYCDKAADEIERLQKETQMPRAWELDDTREYTPNGRNLVVAAKRLRDAKDDELRLIARRDPSMIRDVAGELLLEIARNTKSETKD